MSTIRVYALILGPVLSEKRTRIGECVIQPMSLKEQKQRQFRPISKNGQLERDTFHKTYIATATGNFDQRVIKTKHVIYVDVRTGSPESAINIAYRIFEECIGALSISCVIERKLPSGLITDFFPYDYQLVKLYEVNGEIETKINFTPFKGGSYKHLNFPRHSFEDFGMSVNDIELVIQRSNFDSNLRLATEYLMYAVRSQTFGLPSENIVLNLCKSMEAILKAFKHKRGAKSLYKKVESANEIFQLSSTELESIKALIKIRNGNDIAHSAESNLFHQYYLSSLPTTKSKMIVIMRQPDIVAKMLKNYIKFANTLIHVKAENYQRKADRYIGLTHVVNQGFYKFETNTKKSRQLTLQVKKQIAKDLNVPFRAIKKYAQREREFLFQIVGHKFNSRTKRFSSILLG